MNGNGFGKKIFTCLKNWVEPDNGVLNLTFNFWMFG
jgi:hypothetical protein